MLKRIIANRLFVGLASAAVVGGSIAYLTTPLVAQANLDVTFDDTKTRMDEWHMVRIGAGSISCAGRCRTATTANTFVHKCNLLLDPQASTAACLTALAAACTTSACSAVEPP